MICPKCGRPVETSAVICAGCDFILDTDFLGDEILDEEQSLRPGAGGVDPAVFNLADAVILGDIDEDAQSFETSDSGFHVRETTNARLYVSGRSQAMMAPDAVPAVTDNASNVRLTPFEKHVLSFIDGKRPVESIRIQAGLDEVEVKTALATLADKGVVEVVGRALVESDPVLETHPRRRRPRVHKGIAGAVGAGFDDTDRAIEEAFRTQTNLAALSDLEPNSEIGAFSGSDDREPSSTLSVPHGSSYSGYDSDPGTSEVTGLRDNILAGELPSDADSFTVPGLTGEVRQVIGSDGSDTPRVPTTPKPSVSASDGFDDFGGPSEIATALVQGPSLGSSSSEIFSDSGEADTGNFDPDFDSFDDDALGSETGNIDPISHGPDTMTPVSEASISSMSSMEASLVRPRMQTDAPGPPSRSSDISFISEDDVVRSAMRRARSQVDPESTGLVSRPPSLPIEDELLISGDADEDATGVISSPPSLPASDLSDDATGVISHPPSLPPSDLSDDATGVISSPPSLPPSLGNATAVLSGVENFTANGDSRSGAWASAEPSSIETATANRPGIAPAARPARRPTRRNAGLNSGDRRRQRARDLFEDALNDYDQGRVGAARMNAKLACVYDPDNEEYKAALDAWEGGSRRAAAPPSDNGSVSAPPEVPEFAILYEQAQEHENAGEFVEAIEVLQRAAGAYPEIAAIHNRLGVILALRMKDYARAVESIRKAIEIEPNNLHYRSNLGKIEMRKRRAAS